MMQRVSFKAQLGFTLIEIVLALGLTAMLLGLLSTGVFIVAGDWNRNSDELDDSLDRSLSVLQIDRALHGAFPHSFLDDESLERLIYFVGEEDYISWVSTVSPNRSPGLTAWQLFAVEDEGTYLKLAPAFSDNPDIRLQEAEPILILPNYEISLSYLFNDLDGRALWAEEWNTAEVLMLPLAVYVRLRPMDRRDSKLEEMEIVARIRNNQHRSIRPNLNQDVFTPL